MEEILKQLLTEVQGLKNGQNQITKRLDSMEKGQQDLKEEVSAIKSDITGMKSDITDMKSDIVKLDNKIDVLAAHQEENVMGLLSLSNSKIDALITNVATKEDIVGLDSKFEVLNSRLFHQEAELHRLKVVK